LRTKKNLKKEGYFARALSHGIINSAVSLHSSTTRTSSRLIASVHPFALSLFFLSAPGMMDSAVSLQFVLLAADDEHAQGVSKKGEVRVPRG
jgi:hypothetical protein